MATCIDCSKLIKGRILQNKCESCYQRKFASVPKQETRICPFCNQEFLAIGTQVSQKKFCSEVCYKLNKRVTAVTIKAKAYKKQWAKNNRDKTRVSSMKTYSKKKKDPTYRLKLSQISRFRFSFKKTGLSVTSLVKANLGCSIDELKKYIEQQWEPWMSWDNYGRYSDQTDTWQIDHIKPLAWFDLSNPDHIKEVCHYSNLQPLLAKANLSLGDKRHE